MNFNASIPQVIEAALADQIQRQEPGVVLMRCWHNLRNDHTWNPTTDRTLPAIEIRCSPPTMQPTQVSQYCTIDITCISLTDDDLDHAQINQMELAVTNTIDILQHDFFILAGEWESLKAAIQAERPDIVLGGLLQAAPMPPTEGDGLNMVAFTVEVHFCRQTMREEEE